MTHASLFSGIGGAEIAAAQMGWSNLFHCEINPFGRRVLEYWYPNSTSYEDITKTDFTPWRGQIDVLTGGFPCQPFSLAGSRKGTDDDRYLWPQMLRRYVKSGPLGSLARMLLESSRWFSPARRLKWEAVPLCSEKITEKEYSSGNSSPSKPSAQVLSEKVTKSSRLVFRLVPSERPTAGTGCGSSQGALLPTPTSIDSGSWRINKSTSPNAKERPTIALAAKMGLLPTPMSTEVRHGQRVKELKEAGGDTFHSRKNGETRPNGLMDYMDFHGMLPTPEATNGKHTTFPASQKYRHGLVGELMRNCLPSDGKDSPQLNPLFVEEMMGFPPGWLASPFLSGGAKP